MQKIAAKNIEEYIAHFPKEVQKKLRELKKLIKREAPQSIEAMKYGIPTFVLNKNLVHFAAYKTHIGFYPAPSGLQAFKKKISKYKSSKGAVQFPLDEPLPLALISKIVKFRVKENSSKSK